MSLKSILSKVSSNKIARDSILSIVVKIIYTIVTPISVILLARILGPEEYGIYAFVISVMILLSVPVKFGLPVVIVRFVSVYLNINEYGKIKGIIRFTNIIVLFASATLILLGYVLLKVDVLNLDEKKIVALYIGLPLILILGLEAVRSASLKGIGKVIIGQVPEMIVRPVILILLLLCIYIINGEVNVYTGLTIYLSAAFIAFVVGVILLFKNIPLAVKYAQPLYEKKKWLIMAFPLLWLGSVQVVGGQVDIILLGIFRSASEVGIYKAIYQIAILTIFGVTAISTVMAPKIATLYNDQNINELKKNVFQANILIFAISLPPFLILLFAGKWVINILYGAEYLVGAHALIILIVGRLVDALFGIVTILVKMTGNEKQAAIGISIGMAVNLILNLILIPPYGIVGAAIASTSGLVTWNIILYIICIRNININVLSFKNLIVK